MTGWRSVICNLSFLFDAIRLHEYTFPALFLLPCILVKGQETYVDSLKLVLRSTPPGIDHLSILMKLSATAPEGEWEACNDQMKVLAEEMLIDDTSDSTTLLSPGAVNSSRWMMFA